VTVATRCQAAEVVTEQMCNDVRHRPAWAHRRRRPVGRRQRVEQREEFDSIRAEERAQVDRFTQLLDGDH
jgi:hypothetical protein